MKKWWNQIVLIDNQKNCFSRSDIILLVCDQDGGAHVDPKIQADYHNLTRENGISYETGSLEALISRQKNTEIITGSELATVRQIGHEILKTFKVQYSKKSNTDKSIRTLRIGNITIGPSASEKLALDKGIYLKGSP